MKLFPALSFPPGVWIGPLQEQPGEGHERLGIRSVQLTGYVQFQNQSEVQGTEKKGNGLFLTVAASRCESEQGFMLHV